MNNRSTAKIEALLKKGVKIHNPDSVDVDETVDVDRISGDGVVIYSGCKIMGHSTLILQGAILGYEGPVTVESCHIGPQVELKGGFFKDAVFLKSVSMGIGSHVREGTILEEESKVAHTVALKHTILFPFVTLGSLINFCDCFLSGGTSRKDHSEVGSSYIHFNYTPNQDKATPSLMGDVPQGVMLNQRPIFLGGQGGLVGPCRLAFGTLIAAGSVYRKDEFTPGQLLFAGVEGSGSMPFQPGLYRNMKRIVQNNIIYIANLMALMQWYHHVRSQFVSDDFPESLYDGLKKNLKAAIDERINKLEHLCNKMPVSVQIYQKVLNEGILPLFLQQQNEVYNRRSDLKENFDKQQLAEGNKNLRDPFLENIHLGIKHAGKDYLLVIQQLQPEISRLGTQWLQGIVDHITGETFGIIPSFR
jgi:bifunctional UDP-N-acetylglucosamine pyrophosphorylase/glucosamine-1-phosphate N-acetyltransferase